MTMTRELTTIGALALFLLAAAAVAGAGPEVATAFVATTLAPLTLIGRQRPPMARRVPRRRLSASARRSHA